MGIKKIFSQYSTEKEIWTIAIRKKAEVPLYRGNGEEFIPIKKSVRYWRADPFVFKYKGVNYLFAEMFDRLKNKGVIGVAKIKNGKVGGFKVCLDLKYHLSYPCVFEENGNIFMVPECCASGKTLVYKCEKFPLKWKPCYTLFDGEYVDTTPFYNEESGKKMFFTSRFTEESGGNDNLYIFDGKDFKPVAEKNYKVRSAGNLFYDGGLIRPAQDGTKTYGCGLLFYKAESIAEPYSEKKIVRVCLKDEKTDESDLELSIGNGEYIGIHTYNFSEDYEVIDLLVKEQKNLAVLYKNRKKVFQALTKKVKRRFGK